MSLDVRAASAARAAAFCSAFVSEKSRPRYLFGRNQYASSIADQVDVDGFIDDFTSETQFHGRPVVKLEALEPDAMIVNCVAVGRPLTAQRRIDAFGYDQLDYYAFLRHSGLALAPIEYWTGFADHYREQASRYAALSERLADPFSREVLARIVGFRLSGDLDLMRPFSDTQARQYFEYFIGFGEHEVFADIGAFDGVTSQAFSQRAPDFAGICLFEPNPRNLETARARMGHDPRIRYIAAALSDQEGVARFGCSGSSSRLNDHGEVEVRLDRLDNYGDTPFTYLKMDVEGAEAAVIRGAQGVIEARRPRLAVSVYHRPADLVEIADLVLGIRDDYDLFLRHYTEGFTETVLYCLPRS